MLAFRSIFLHFMSFRINSNSTFLHRRCGEYEYTESPQTSGAFTPSNMAQPGKGTAAEQDFGNVCDLIVYSYGAYEYYIPVVYTLYIEPTVQINL